MKITKNKKGIARRFSWLSINYRIAEQFRGEKLWPFLIFEK